MAEMFVQSPQTTHVVREYDLVFESGMVFPVTIDTSKGDTITISDTQIQVHLSAKPSQNDPNKTLMAEDQTFFVSKLVAIQTREREFTEPTPAQKQEWAKEFKDLLMAGGTVQ